jgi:uncharacterized protein (TIGR00369 family)
MPDSEHFRALERMYHSSPASLFFEPTLRVEEGRAEVSIRIREEFHHAAGAVHGSVCFKALDDAAFFAVQSLVRDRFIVTASFTIELLRPVSEGTLRAAGRVVEQTDKRYVAESELTDDEGNTVARGRGRFARSRVRLGPELGYFLTGNE